MSNLRVQALREIAREKETSRGKKYTVSSLEKAAQEWDRRQSEQEKEEQDGKQLSQEDDGIFFNKLSSKEVLRKQEQTGTDAFDWVQFNPHKKEEKKEQPRLLNTATIHGIAKKIMAREWRRAKGIRKQDPRIQNLEREIESWRERKELEQRIQREKEERIMKYVKKFNSALNEFSRKLVNDCETLYIEKAATIFNDVLEEELGEIFKIDWLQEGCKVWFEPWEEKRQRRIRRESFPSIFEAVIDGNMDISSFEEVESTEVKSIIIEEALVQSLEDSIEFGDLNESELEKAIEDALSDFGRLATLKRTQKGWTAAVEPWEDVRRRNIERMSPDPHKYTIVNISSSEDNLSFSVMR